MSFIISKDFLKDREYTASETGQACLDKWKMQHRFSKYKSYLTERGYTSYKYNNNQLRHYVHGNSDAVSISNNLSYLLGVSSFLKRHYRLQFDLINSEKYEFIIVNYTNKKQEVSFAFIDTSTNKKIS